MEKLLLKYEIVMKIGFIGLGNVGGKLASSLLKNKFELTVRDLNKDLIKDFQKKGAKIASSPVCKIFLPITVNAGNIFSKAFLSPPTNIAIFPVAAL